MTREPRSPAPVLTEQQVRRSGPFRALLVRRPLIVDAFVAACFAGWALLTGIGADSMYTLHAYLGGDQVLQMQYASVVLTVLGSAALLLRRRRPLPVALVMACLGVVALAVTGTTSGFEVGVAIALHAVSASQLPRVTWLSFTAAVLALLVAAPLLPQARTVGTIIAGTSADRGDDVGLAAFVQGGAWYQTALPVLVLALVAVALGIGARNDHLHVARLVEAANASARDQVQRADLARAAERARIAREMHDVVAHSISVMVALGGGASIALEEAPDRARIALDELTATGRSALTDMRRVLGVLDERSLPAFDVEDDGSAVDDATTSPLPGIAELEALVERFQLVGMRLQASGLDDRRLRELDAGLQLTVHRVAQEALTNALRHAPGSQAVELRVDLAEDAVEVVITDRGPTAPVVAVQGTGRGLLGMRERAAAFRGTVEAGAHEGGWRVRVLLPRDEETR